jgi:hypothetical protein
MRGCLIGLACITFILVAGIFSLNIFAPAIGYALLIEVLPPSQTLKITTPVCGNWQSTANATASFRDLSGVSPNDIWAVGSSSDETQPGAYHWDGHTWNSVSIPTTKDGEIASLGAVEAKSENDVWVLGYTANSKSVTLHWDGKTWSIMPASKRQGLDMWNLPPLSPYNVWAVGIGGTILTWDGSDWNVQGASCCDGPILEEAAVISPNDMWAVGAYYHSVSSENAFYVGQDTLTMHWDGKSWNRVASPNAHSQNALHAVAAISSDDVWAVGDAGFDKNLVMHWDGKELSIVPGPEPMNEQHLFAVTAAGPDQIWVAGWARVNEDSPQYPLIASFTKTACPNEGK